MTPSVGVLPEAGRGIVVLRDKRIRYAFTAGVVSWIIVGGIVLLAEGSSRYVIAGIILVMATWLQFLLLFYQRRSGAFAKAQALFVQGDFENAATQLERILTEQSGDVVQAQTLLGNAYRQLGRLQDSEAALRAALESKPDDHFPLYGLGRTLLAQGRFAEAAACIQEALDNKGRKVMRAELALAHYLDDNRDAALAEARRTVRMLQLEPHRVLMVNYILRRLEDDPRALSVMARMADAVAFWEAEAERFSDTPYGEALQREIAEIRQLLAAFDRQGER